METINSREGLVLITKRKAIVHNNSGRFGEVKPGFFINQPIAGFVSEEYWEAINIFQNLNIENDEVIKEMIREGKETTEECLLNCPNIKKWLKLQEKMKSFYNIVEEFNVLVGINHNGEPEYRRCYCLLGNKDWELVKD